MGAVRNFTASEVAAYLHDHPDFAHNWFSEHATPNTVQKWTLEHPEGFEKLVTSISTFTRRRCSSLTSKTFKDYKDGRRSLRGQSFQSLSKKEILEGKTEQELFYDLVCDVSNELDVMVLCHKILRNVSLLTSSDRGSLFLARGSSNNRHLVAQLFDVTTTSTLETSIVPPEKSFVIPFGEGIAGHVAKTKETINITNAYEDVRFNKSIDEQTGYRTHGILCMPMLNYEGEVIGVAELVNKTTGVEDVFTKEDEKLFQRYLTFCGIGLTNAQLFEMSLQEYRKNELLLSLAKSIFQEQMNLENMVRRIMQNSRELLRCERCTIYLLENACKRESMLDIMNRVREKFNGRSTLWGTSNLSALPDSDQGSSLGNSPSGSRNTSATSTTGICCFEKAFYMSSSDEIQILQDSELEAWPMLSLAHFVARSGECLNIPVLEDDHRFQIADKSNSKEKVEEKRTSVLCMPIRNSQNDIIAVAEVAERVENAAFCDIDSLNGKQFSEADVVTFEAFVIFCGLGIQNTLLYENAVKLMAKQVVALEVLSYHASANQDEAETLSTIEIPDLQKYQLTNFEFSDFSLSDMDTVKATVRMFLDLDIPTTFRVPHDVLCRWILSVKKNYRSVLYHNWRHAFNVTQTMFCMFKSGGMEQYFTETEKFVLLVACLSHDLDHRGTNNAFQIKVESPLAVLYSTSTMEHHHFDHCITILHTEGNNIFSDLSPDQYRRAIKILKSAILSTDLALYFKKRHEFNRIIDSGEMEWKTENKKSILREMMMTACDLAAITKPWEVQKKIATLVASEFFQQGDIEKSALHQQPEATMDREKEHDLPRMQVSFINSICLPIYKTFYQLKKSLKPMLEGVESNKVQWMKLAEEKVDIESPEKKKTRTTPDSADEKDDFRACT